MGRIVVKEYTPPDLLPTPRFRVYKRTHDYVICDKRKVKEVVVPNSFRAEAVAQAIARMLHYTYLKG